MPLKQISDINMKVPVLIAGWPGMGRVGIGAATYLRRQLKATLVARLDVTSYQVPEAIIVKDGVGRLPDPPSQLLYLAAEIPLFIFEGDTQFEGATGLRVAGELLDACQRYGVQTVYTGAAFAVPASFREPIEVFGVATDERLKATFASLQVKPLEEGRITGLNGLLLGMAGARGMAAACFLATMPQYAVEAPNPKASKAVVEVFQRILNTGVDMAEIDRRIRDTDRMLAEFESRVTAAIQELKSRAESLAESGESSEEGEPGERPEPPDLMARIEQLFEEAQNDRTKAIILKQELDRWGMFHRYEDRFLDLFDKKRPNPRIDE